jgi:hypothetical protein
MLMRPEVEQLIERGRQIKIERERAELLQIAEASQPKPVDILPVLFWPVPNWKHPKLWYQMPIPLRLANWFLSVIDSPYRIKRFLLWSAIQPVRAFRFLQIQFGGTVDESAYMARMQACHACPNRAIVLDKAANPHGEYCLACRCPKWRLAELTRKNRKAKWQCPDGRWDEMQALDKDVLVRLAALGVEPKPQCSSCGR